MVKLGNVEKYLIGYYVKVLVLDWKVLASTWLGQVLLSTCTSTCTWPNEKYLYLTQVLKISTWPTPGVENTHCYDQFVLKYISCVNEETT